MARTGEAVANDRKLYYPEDVERLKRILVLTTYGFSLDEVAVILDNDRAVKSKGGELMKAYELLFIVAPTIDDETRAGVMKRIETTIDQRSV